MERRTSRYLIRKELQREIIKSKAERRTSGFKKRMRIKKVCWRDYV